jgi:hypothetical protein
MNTKRPFHVFVGRNVTADATGVANLDNGEIIFIKRNGNMLAPGDTIADSDGFSIMQGTATLGDIEVSGFIQGKNITKWEGKSYAAPVEQVIYIGNNGTVGDIEDSTLLNETLYALTIVFKFDKDILPCRQDRYTFEYTTDASATVAELVLAFVAAINAHPYCSQFVVAAAVGANIGISLTGLAQTYNENSGYKQTTFDVFLDEAFTQATWIDSYGYIKVDGAAPTTTNAVSIAPVPGVGTYALLNDLEEYAQGYKGVFNKTHWPVPSYPTYGVSGATYDVYVIEHEHNHQGVELQGQTTSPRKEYIFIPAGTALGTYVESVLNPYMASTPKQFSAVTL